MRTKTMQNEWIRWITASGILGLAAIAPAQVVTGLSKTESDGGVQFKVSGRLLPAPKQIELMKGSRFVLQFNAKLEGKAQHMAVNVAGVKQAKLVWYRTKPPIVRVMLTTNGKDVPVVTGGPDGYTITVGSTIALAKPEDIAPTTAKVAEKDGPQISPNTIQPYKATMATAALATPKAKDAKKATEQRLSLVSLDFVNTEVVQILKALALQADVNIVTSPDVQGRKITVSLDKVHVKDALDFVTTLSGLKYAQVQDSYVVTTSDEFGSVMNGLADRTQAQNVIRIVPIVSGDGGAIKSALAQWFGPSTLQVLLPGDDKSSAGAAKPPSQGNQAGPPAAGGNDAAAAGAAGAAQAAGAAGAGAAKPAASGSQSTDVAYLTLIGDKKWVDQAEDLVKRLDGDVVEARNEARRAKRDLEASEAHESQAIANEMAKQLEASQSQDTYVVQNGIADDLKAVIEDTLKGSGVSVVASPAKSNVQTIVVSGPADRVKSTMAMMQQLDTGAGVGSEVFTYDIKFVDPRSLREDLIANVPGLIVTNPPAGVGEPRVYQKNGELNQVSQAEKAAQGQAGQAAQSGATGGAAAAGGNSGAKSGGGTMSTTAGVFQDSEPNAEPMRLMLRGSQSQIDRALAYLAKVDIPPKQIAIEMRVMELAKEDALKLGIDWSLLTGGAVKAISLNESQSGIGQNTSPANSVLTHIGLNKGSGSVTATLDAIANKNNLISRPNLIAQDGREAEIFVGDDIQYVQSIVTSQTGPTITSADLQVGVRLSVFPRIGGDGNITMDLRPNVSFLKGFTSTTSSTVTLNLPQTSWRVSQSTVTVKSGETIAIGGLIQDQDVYDVQKVPILGDIPILGHLFRQTTHDRTRSEVVFFLTVREIGPDDLKSAADPKANEQRNGTEMPIPKRNIIK